MDVRIPFFFYQLNSVEERNFLSTVNNYEREGQVLPYQTSSKLKSQFFIKIRPTNGPIKVSRMNVSLVEKLLPVLIFSLNSSVQFSFNLYDLQTSSGDSRWY